MSHPKTDYERLLGRSVAKLSGVAGGDIGHSARIVLEDGTALFAKHYPGAPAAMAQAEAEGLSWLREAGALRVPEVVAAAESGAAILVLEWIEQGRPADDFDEALGRGLAALHASGAAHFGFAASNFIGSLPQRNRPHARWADFYAEERIGPQTEMAARAGLLPDSLERDLERLSQALCEFCGPQEPPARLHGDLWAGNRIVDELGRPCLIDPAAYGGHREVDLAMMKLFGGFSPRVFDAYREVTPLAPGADERVALYQLYPLLVHVNLFGSRYTGQVAERVRRYL
ncbi:MAG: fructosamine kinase family protein [bacterium]|nr:fructosamine kinase family protein [bacterium]